MNKFLTTILIEWGERLALDIIKSRQIKYAACENHRVMTDEQIEELKEIDEAKRILET